MDLSQLDSSSLFNVQGLVAVVTGGGTGIGLMIAKTLEHNGATVYIVGRRLHVLEKAARENNRFGNLIPLKGDVTSRESLLSVVDTIKKQKGYINVLINNAGVAHNLVNFCEPVRDMKEFQDRLWNAGTPEEFTKTFDSNVTSVYYTTVAFLELLHAGNRRSGPYAPSSQVISMSSVGGFRKDERQYSLSYGLSKAAVTHLGKTLANILKSWKIRSNVIAPGIYPSEMTEGLVDEHNITPEMVPLQRAGNIEDMGGLVLFLVSRAGSYVNGAVQLTDGGRLGLFSSTY